MEATLYPDDLMHAQREWHCTYEALAALPPTAGATTLRRRLLRLSSRIAQHPHWSARGCPSAARAELRRAARAPEAMAA
ncbi:hypothetical protein [Streptomyces sp. NBC_01669]|uniref:hypothetical protein n=1 Tax=Streptomyces sp. NBC_01669 TaxID=2975909 RepID=UPI002251D204|nr:hypothetical protein [Streptomyces sp. NBC_01669]MCX4531022.1 hypothetical protein [Streptomyces sp. NBC_01669]